MLFEQSFVLLCCVLVLQTKAIEIKKITYKITPGPFDLLDDALAQLDVLAQAVLGNILVAQDELDKLSYDVDSHSINIELNAEVDILQEQSTLDQQVSSLKGLALAADKNISFCLYGNEDTLNKLPATYRTQLSDCIFQTHDEADQILIDSNYAVDIIMSKVQALNFTLNQCSSDDSVCISNVINEIQSSSTDLPLQIEVEVNSATDGVEIVKVKIQNCSDAAIAGYVEEGSDIVSKITACVNEILS